MAAYLWGLSGGVWHALTKHDPDFASATEPRVSEKLTLARQAKDPGAEPVTYLVLVRKPGPGTGHTLCGLEALELEQLGVDPALEDPLCAICEAKAAK